MRAVSFFLGTRRGMGQLALAGALLVCAMGAAQAQPQIKPYYLNQCSLFQIGETGNGGATPWRKTGQDTATVNNVIAQRTVSINAVGKTATEVDERDGLALLQGARWSGAPNLSTHLIPTNVDGLSIRISGAMNQGAYVRPLDPGNFLTIYSGSSEARNSVSFTFGDTVVVEVVVTGPVAPGSHTVSDLASTWKGTRLEILATQRDTRNTPALGAVMQVGREEGKPANSNGNTCYDVKVYTVSDILTLDGGGGGLPVEAKCTVDAKFQGAGFSLPMGNYAAADFRSDGALSKEVPFEVSVHTCAAGAKPKIGFNAQYGLIPGASNVLQLKDHTAVTSAKNLGIILTRQGNDQPLVIGQGSDVGNKYEFDNLPGAGVAQNSGAEIKLGARYRRTDQQQPSGVQAGIANSQVNFNIYYD
ncbi:fimbrial protein [Achromobacter marplatensis]|nr:fimbrial protein [Achromobacter marplatensis]